MWPEEWHLVWPWRDFHTEWICLKERGGGGEGGGRRRRGRGRGKEEEGEREGEGGGGGGEGGKEKEEGWKEREERALSQRTVYLMFC